MATVTSAMQPIEQLVSYEDRLALRDVSGVSLVVIHCTELPDLEMARSYAEVIHYAASATGNSGHYYIDRDGTVVQYVRDHRVAHHVKGHNESSIGIELVNRGRFPDWYDSRSQHMTEPYSDKQIRALGVLLRHLERQLPNLQYIAGHADLDTSTVAASDDPEVRVRRKLDPGPQFPWSTVLSAVRLERYEN